MATHNATGSVEGAKRERREVLSESALAFGGFTEPEPFLQLFKPLAKTKDGFLDRILMCSIKPHLLHEEEVERSLKDTSRRDLLVIILISKILLTFVGS